MSLGVEVYYIGDRVVADSAYRGEPGEIPFYSLYHDVDILTFPSYQEGFGNQYLEAVAFGKGIVVCHAYPVMEADILPLISPEGIISLGNNREYTLDETGLIRLNEEVLQAAIDREIHFLLHPDEEKTIAVVYMANHCGSLCGSGMFHVLQKKEGIWKPVSWQGKGCGWVS